MVSERIQRQIDRLLDRADEAVSQLDWEAVRQRAEGVLRLDPSNADALTLLEAATRDLASLAGTGTSPDTAVLLPPVESGQTMPASLANGRYEVEAFLGEGGKKRVYRGHDSVLDRDVALAVIKVEGLDPTSRVRITREAQAMGRLGDHPHVLSIHDLGEDNGQPYMVLPLMPGGDVGTLLEKAEGHRLPLEQAIDLAAQICRGLEFAHSKDIVHRDLKPGNIWLASDGTAKIGDFGLAVAIDRSRLTQEGMMVGTVSYMPPEQAMGSEVTAKADLYSLGAMLYEMVCGRPPFLGDDSVAIIGQHINTPPVAPTWHRSECPRALEAVIMRLLAKDPKERPESATDVLTALEGVDLGDVGADGRPPDEAHALDSLAGGVFVGRQREMGELKAALEDALSGRGRLVTLVGEPGIGKTRTAQELATYAGLRGCQVLWGRCHESRGAPPYWPWVQAIRSYVRERDPERLRSEMGTGAADIAEIVSDVRECIPDLKPAPAVDDPEQARFRLFDSITAFLKSASRGQPLVIILDNLHWADKPSLLLLEFLAQEFSDSRLLVIGTYRDVDLSRQHPLVETLAELTRERLFQRVLLRGLSQDDVGRFIEITSGIGPPAGLLQAVHTQTEGNPLFVTEVVRLLVQEGELSHERTRERDSWDVRIPEGVREVIGRRLNRLSQRCNETLTIASVIGREFEMRHLVPLVEDMSEDRLLEVLEEALAARTIEELPQAMGQYQFTHALIRQTLFDELSTTRRVQLSANILQALEILHAGDIESHAVDLAYHAAEAEATIGSVKLVRYSVIAGERAISSYAYEEALVHFQKALAARVGSSSSTDSADVGQGVDAETATILFGLGRAQVATFAVAQAQEAVDTLRRAFDAFVDLGDTENALALATHPHAFLGFTSGSADMAARAMDFVSPDSLEAGYLLSRHGHAHHLENKDYEGAQENLDRAVEIARREGDRVLEVRALSYIAQMHWIQGHHREAVEKVLPVIELARSLGELEVLVRARGCCTTALLSIGDGNGAQIHATAGLEAAERLRNSFWLVQALGRNASLAMLRGEWKIAQEFNARALAESPGEPSALAHAALLNLEVGDLEKSNEYVKQIVKEMPDVLTGGGFNHTNVAALIPMIARVTGITDLIDVAESAAREVLSSVSTLNLVDNIARAGLALIAIQRSDADSARVQYPFLESQRGTLFSYPVSAVPCCDRILGLLAHTMGKLDDAATHFEDALAFCRKAGYRPELTWTCCDYADMLLERDAEGDRQRALALLDESLAISSDLGMRPLMERVLSRKMSLQGIDVSSPQTSIEAVVSAVEVERPNLQTHAAPDGTVTIMFTDIEGSTAMTERLGDARAQEVLRIHNTIIREQVAAHYGFEVKAQGDGFMVAFSSARRALECAIAIQHTLAAHNAENPGEPIRVRIGLHTGEAIKEGEDFFGKSVILAARITSQALGEQILVSSLMKGLVESSGEFAFGDAQAVELKGLAGSHQMFDVKWDEKA